MTDEHIFSNYQYLLIFSQPSFCRRQKDQLGISSHCLKNGDCIENINSGVAPSLRFVSPIENSRALARARTHWILITAMCARHVQTASVFAKLFIMCYTATGTARRVMLKLRRYPVDEF